jgi:crotonobetainyl-CoA:carnitine CoA-transferase CaiB-like acyl-CoA transferase
VTRKPRRDVLSGITVLELGGFITAPYAALLLADLGADVIKIEPPGGDPFRSFGLGKYSPNFVGYNRNKRSAVLDIKEPEGRALFLDLVKQADVVIENFRPGVLERLKLDYTRLRRVNPGLVFCSISGFNRAGPNRDRPAFDLIGQAISGMLGIFLDPANPAVRGPTISDQLAGFYACYGILGALYARTATDKGRRIDVNMIEATMSFMPDVFASFTRDNVVMESQTRAAYSQAYAFVCGDGDLVAIQLSSLDKFWIGLCRAIEAPRLADDERFSTRMQRIKNYDVLMKILAEAFRGRPRDEWLKRLTQADVPHAPVHGIDEAMRDPEVASSDSFYEVQHPEMGAVTCIHRPVLYDGARHPGRYAPPVLGEHTDEVLRRARRPSVKAATLRGKKPNATTKAATKAAGKATAKAARKARHR